MASRPKHDVLFHLERAQGHAISLWNNHHKPCIFFYRDPKYRKPVIYAPETIKIKLEKYFDEDPELLEAFDEDLEIMNLDFTDKPYFAEPTKKTFN